MNQMRKQKGVTFAVPYVFVSLGKVPRTMMQSRDVRDEDRAFGDPGSSKPAIAARMILRMTRNLRWYSPNLNYIHLIKGGESQNNEKFLQKKILSK